MKKILSLTILLSGCINMENWERGIPLDWSYPDGSSPIEMCINYESYRYDLQQCNTGTDKQECIKNTKLYYGDFDDSEHASYKKSCEAEARKHSKVK